MTTAPPTGGEGRRLRRLRQLTEVPVAKLASTTDRQVADLEAIGIETVFDLLTTYPRRYLDRSRQVDLEGLFPGTEATILATVRAVRSRRTRQGKAMVELDVDDGTATVTVVFFNQPWRAKQLRAGTTALFFGKAQSYRGQVQLANPVVDVVAHDDPAAALDKMLRIVAVYPQSTKGNLTSYDLAQMVAEALDRAGQFLDPLDDVLRERLGLIDRTTAFREIHLPSSMELQAEARQRLAFDELLRLQLALGLRRQVIEREARGIVHHIEPGVFDGEVPHSLVGSLLASLPYQLTRAQRRAVEEIFDDLTAPLPMHRLLQGDVGSGKTVVALLGMLAVIDAGRQAALMAPTEVLAEQHAQSLAGLITGLSVADPSSLLGRRPLRIATLSSRLTAAQRTATLAGLAEGTIDLVVGTHALLTDEVRFAALGLAVIDEQHRFGVEQRAVLRDKGRDEGEGADPDLLVMTATPIPRTAAMVVFGDLDMTVLDELPEGRQQIHTHWASSELEVEAVWAAVRAEVAAGRQVYSRYCASCHGVHLEGQAHWDRPGEGGYFPAPPHDASGHTWEHSDKELHELIANSVYAYTAPGYRSHMPAFAGTLSDAEIDSVIAYIKSTWPASLQAYQRVLNPAGIDFKDLPPGWKFPPTCRFHARS